MTFLKYIIRYPIKGLNGEFMNTANLHPGSTISDSTLSYSKRSDSKCKRTVAGQTRLADCRDWDFIHESLISEIR